MKKKKPDPTAFFRCKITLAHELFGTHICEICGHGSMFLWMLKLHMKKHKSVMNAEAYMQKHMKE